MTALDWRGGHGSWSAITDDVVYSIQAVGNSYVLQVCTSDGGPVKGVPTLGWVHDAFEDAFKNAERFNEAFFSTANQAAESNQEANASENARLEDMRQRMNLPVTIEGKGHLTIGGEEFPYVIVEDGISVQRTLGKNVLTVSFLVGDVEFRGKAT